MSFLRNIQRLTRRANATDKCVPALRLQGMRLISDDAAGLADAETWLGRPLGFVTAFAESGNAAGTWSDSLAATLAQIAALAALNRRIYWAFPLCHGAAGHGAVETARGDHDAMLRVMFRAIADARQSDDLIFLRLGWEMNFWSAYPWGRANVTPAEYIEAYRHVVEVGRGIDGRFVFDWTPNARVLGADGKVIDPTISYPGDAWVDIVGVDAYLRYEIDVTINGLTPLQALNAVWDGEWGIASLYAWAEGRGKPFLIAETGINGDGTANNGVSGDLYSAHINRLAEFVASKHIVLHGYWNKSSPFNCRLTAGQYPAAAVAYKAAFDGIARPWTPALQFGRELVQHRDASDVSTLSLTGALVDAWADKVGAKSAVSTGSARPTYSPTARNGMAGVTGDGGDDVLVQVDVASIPASGTALTTFVQAYVAPAAVNFSYLLADCDATGGATNTRALGHNAGNLRVQGANVAHAGGPIRSIDASIVVAWRAAYDAVTKSATVIGSINGGAPWADNVALPQPSTPFTKHILFGNGAAGDGVANRIAATIQEVGTISRAITQRERQCMHGYLAHKWGRVSDLPQSHPFKTAPPTYGGPLG